MNLKEITINEINVALKSDSMIRKVTIDDLEFIKIYKEMVVNPEKFEELKIIINYIYSCIDIGFGDYSFVGKRFSSIHAAYYALSLNLTTDDFKSPFLDMCFENIYEIDNCLNFKNLCMLECYKRDNTNDIMNYINCRVCDMILTFPNFDGNENFVKNKINNIIKDLESYKRQEI